MSAGAPASAAFATARRRARTSTPTDHLSVKEARRADRFTQLAIVACSEALADAGWEDELPYAPERVGCVVGTGIGGIGTIVNGQDVLREHGPERVSPLSIPLMMSNAARRRPVAAPRAAGAELRGLERLRLGRARAGQRAADDPQRRSRRGRRGRLGGRADAARPGLVRRAGRAV